MTHVRPSGLNTKGTYQRTVWGIALTLVGLGALLAVLLPFRAHLSIAIPALVFVLPALVGVVIGGFLPGVVGALGGFVVYDLFFLPPYNTLTVRSPQNWIALAVYAVVVLVVSQVVAKLRSAREEAERRTAGVRTAVRAVAGTDRRSQLVGAADAHGRHRADRVFAPRWTALVLPDERRRRSRRGAAGRGQRRASP